MVLANQEYDLFAGGLTSNERRLRRVELRLKKAEDFINYLVSEEDKEIAAYGLQERPRFAPQIREKFEVEKEAVLRSARKQNVPANDWT
jgi:hypothetical protein